MYWQIAVTIIIKCSSEFFKVLKDMIQDAKKISSNILYLKIPRSFDKNSKVGGYERRNQKCNAFFNLHGGWK